MGGRTVPYTLKRSRRRTIGFTISHDGLKVAAPQRASLVSIERALESKQGWILAKLDAWAARPKPRELAFQSGETLPWLGGELRLDIETGGVRTTVKLDGDRLVLRADPALEGELRRRTLTAAIQRFYKREGEALMTPKVEAYAAQLDRRVRKVIIRDQKRRWGSCASDATIRLNWRLMGFPEALIDYVCAHEAAHLVEPNHSAAYWATVARIMPDYDARRRRMRAESGQWVVL